MSYDHGKGYQIAPGELAGVQAFINTADREEGTDVLADAGKMQAWLRNRGWIKAGGVVKQRDFRRFIELREALRAILTIHTLDPGSPYPPEATTTFNAISADAGLHVLLTANGEAQLASGRKDLDGALALLLGGVFEAISKGCWRRLKACRNPACRWIFYDYSRNRAGAWCEMAACGAKHKVRAYRQRQAVGKNLKSSRRGS